MSAARAWVVVLAVLAAVLGRVGVQAEHEHAGLDGSCATACGERGETRKAPEREKHGCEQCEKYTLAKLGVAPGPAALGLPAARVVEVEGAWARVERAGTRGVGSARARGPPA